MATSAQPRDNKTVTGYPAQTSRVASGYPTTAYAFAASPAPAAPMAITAHPYPYYNNSFQPEVSTLRRLFIFFVFLFTLMVLVLFIVFLVLHPRLPEFRVESASVSALNATGSDLTATWDFTLLANNPNQKLAAYYEDLKASLFYDDVISTTSVPPFSQDTNDSTRIRFSLWSVSAFVGKEAVREISDGMAHGSVRFGMVVEGWVRFRAGMWWMRPQLLRVTCYPVQLGFVAKNGSGSLMGPSRACQVYL